MRKPIVNRSRRIKSLCLIEDIDLELPLDKIVCRFNEILSHPSDLWIATPRIEYNYYGYDGGKELNVVVNVWAETEQEWKERVAREKSALDEYNKKLDKDAYIKELEEKLAKLGG